jgi:hypothetical protein
VAKTAQVEAKSGRVLRPCVRPLFGSTLHTFCRIRWVVESRVISGENG